MIIDELLGFFLSTDPMRTPLAKIVDNGRALAVAYKSLEEINLKLNDSNKKLELDLDKERLARMKDKEFTDKEMRRLQTEGGNAQTIITPILNKLLEIENLLLKQNAKSKS